MIETIKTNFCEEPFYVFSALVIAAVVLVAVWHSTRKTLYLKLLVVPVILAGVVFSLDYFIITDREQIDQASQEIAADLERGRLDAVGYYLDDKFTGYKVSKTLLLQFAQVQLTNMKVQNIKLIDRDVKLAGKQADMTVTSVLDFQGQFQGRIILKWRIHWVKRPQGWRIDEVAPPEQTIPGFN